MLSWRTATGWPSSSASTSTSGPCSSTQLDLRFEAVELTPEGVAAGGHVEQVEVVAVEDDQAGAGGEHGCAAAHERAQWFGEALALDPERHRRGLASGEHEPVESFQPLGRADLTGVRARLGERTSVRLEVALEGENADER